MSAELPVERRTVEDPGAALPSDRRGTVLFAAAAWEMSTTVQEWVPEAVDAAPALTCGLATGTVRRMLVGDPSIHVRDVIAGDPVTRAADAERAATAGQVVADAKVGDEAARDGVTGDWQGAPGGRFTVLTGVERLAAPAPWPSAAREDAPAVDDWGGQRQPGGDLRPELRAVATLFLPLPRPRPRRPGPRGPVGAGRGPLAGGTLLQVTMGDKGGYLYVAFGAPVAHRDPADRAVACALALLATPPDLPHVPPPSVGLDHGIARTGLIGKSHLIEVVQAHLLGQLGVTWLSVAADEVQRGSLHAFLPLLRDLFHQDLAPDGQARRALFVHGIASYGEGMADELQSHLGPLLGHHVAGSAHERLASSPPGRVDRSAHHAAADRGCAAPDRHPRPGRAVAGSSSEQVVECLARTASTAQVCLLIDDRRVGSAWAATGTPTTVVALHPIDRAAVGELASALLGGRADPVLVEAVYDRTRGHPLFAEQVLRHRARAPALAEPAEVVLPDSLTAAVSARIDALTGDAKEAVLAPAVLGEPSPSDTSPRCSVVATWTSGSWRSWSQPACGTSLRSVARSAIDWSVTSPMGCRSPSGCGRRTRWLPACSPPMRIGRRRRSGQSLPVTRRTQATPAEPSCGGGRPAGQRPTARCSARPPPCTPGLRRPPRLPASAPSRVPACMTRSARPRWSPVTTPSPPGTSAPQRRWARQRPPLSWWHGGHGWARHGHDGAGWRNQGPCSSVHLRASRADQTLWPRAASTRGWPSSMQVADNTMTPPSWGCWHWSWPARNRSAIARAAGCLCELERRRGDPHRATAYGLRALASWEAIHDRHGRAMATLVLARAQVAFGDLAAGVARSRDAVQRFEQIGEEHGRAAALHKLGHALHRSGEHEEAMACLSAAVEILTRIAWAPTASMRCCGVQGEAPGCRAPGPVSRW